MMRRATLLLVLTALVPAATVGAAPATPSAATTFVFSGHGWGHGVGLSQYGALGFARRGSTYERILAHYYPGTNLATTDVDRVRVLLAEGKRSVAVSSAVPFTVQTTRGTRRLAPGTYTVPDAAGTLKAPLVFVRGREPLSLEGRAYRGSLRVAQAGTGLQAINLVGLDAYLYGVIAAEMDSRWPAEALKAQAVAARSYAVVSRTGGTFDLYADTRSQVYAGVAAETTSTRAAVDATRRRVVLYEGAVAHTFFSASSGGRTADVTDIWLGSKPVPYLVSVPDPYDSISPYHDWGPVAITATAAAKALSLPGLRGLTVKRAPSERVREVVVGAGSASTIVPGNVFRRALDLRSTWFRIGVLTLEHPQGPVPVNTSVRLRGRVRGLVRAVVEERAASGAWQLVKAVRPGRGGSVAVTVQPVATTDYRLRSGDAATEPVRVTVT